MNNILFPNLLVENVQKQRQMFSAFPITINFFSFHLFLRRSCRSMNTPANPTTTTGSYSNLITVNRESLRLPASYASLYMDKQPQVL